MNKAWISASDFIEDNPHPAFTKVITVAFELWYLIECCEDERCVYVKATSSGQYIGEANSVDSDLMADVQNMWVEPKCRRRGVAKAMFVLLAKIVGKPLGNMMDYLTPHGRALWKHLVRELDDSLVAR